LQDYNTAIRYFDKAFEIEKHIWEFYDRLAENNKAITMEKMNRKEQESNS